MITERNVNEGAYIQTMRMGMGGPPLLQIQQINTIVAVLTLPESEISRLKIGLPVKVKIDSLRLFL